MAAISKMPDLSELHALAERLLVLASQPSLRYLPLRDVLRLLEGDDELRRARAALGDILRVKAEYGTDCSQSGLSL